LPSIPLFSPVEEHEIPGLLKLLHPAVMETDQVLFREKSPGDAMWVLGPGAEVIISATPLQGGRPVVIARAGAGETVGEMALIDQGPRSGTAMVTQPGPAHRIIAAEFNAARGSFQPVAYKILRQICRQLCARLRATSDRLAPSAEIASASSSPEAPQSRATLAEIEEFPPFQKLPEVVKLALAQKLRPVHIDASRPLFEDGQEGDSAYFLLSGAVNVTRHGRTLAGLKPGAMFGLVSLIDQGRRSASCITEGPVRLLRLSKLDFEALFNSGNRFAFQIVDLASRQLVEHLRSADQLLSTSASRVVVGPDQQGEIIPLELEFEISRRRA
jgi:CRP/FNR family transcriptional regulator, cyclic AMP receptor protein